MAELKCEDVYTEVSYAMIGDKKYKLYIGPDKRWYKREIFNVETIEINGYFRPVYELGEYELY